MVGSLALAVLVVLLAWIGEGAAEPIGDALALAGAGWLLGTGVTLAVPAGELGIAPLGITLVFGVLAFRGGTRAAQALPEPPSTRGAVGLTVVAGATAALAGGLVAAVSTSPLVVADPTASAVAVGLLGAVCVGVAVLRSTRIDGPGERVLRSTSPRLRRAVAPAGAVVAVLVMVGAALTSGLLVARASRVADLVASLAPGWLGMLALLLASILLLPTLMVWALAYAVGPGLALGAAGQANVAGVEPSVLPGIPVLGALPQAVPQQVAVLVVVVTYLLAGGAAATVLARSSVPWPTEQHVAESSSDRQGPRRQALAAQLADLGVAAVLAGLAVAWVASYVSGPAGPGNLGTFGPVPWHVALAVSVGVSVVGGSILALRHVRRQLAGRRADGRRAAEEARRGAVTARS